uniref:Uncharacterized protein n=1 Tax=Cyprinus carpio TaxID=7962 RepID=A0A8C1NTT2_CYPCA
MICFSQDPFSSIIEFVCHFYSESVLQIRFCFIMEDTQTSTDQEFSPGCSSVQQKRSEAESSCVSVRSDWSMHHSVKFKSGDTKTDLSSVHQKRSEAKSSCVFMTSDRSMHHLVTFKSGGTKTDLRLRDCGVTDEGCSALASALRSNPSQLRQLCLSLNEIGDLGVKRLCAGLEDPHCKLEILWLNNCGVTDEGCAALASALRSNPSHLRELDLSGNKLGKSGVKLLSDLKDDPLYKLERLYYCKYIII